MRKSIHSESEMVKAVKELESGVSAEVVAREYGISKATLYQLPLRPLKITPKFFSPLTNTSDSHVFLMVCNISSQPNS